MRINEHGVYDLPTDEAARAQGYYLDFTLAEAVIAFCEKFCIQSKAPFAGQPLRLMPWQKALLRTLYGWWRPDGSLRFKRAYIYIPKKQGKSTLLAALCLFHLLKDQGSEVYCLASDIQQAKIVFNQAKDYVENHPGLGQRLWLRDHIKQIDDEKGKSKLKVLSSSKSGKSGFNANLICLDEIAEWPKHSARDVWDRLQDAGAARKNALLITISTAQFDKTHIGYEVYRKAKQVLTGQDDDLHVLPVLYEVEEHDDWRQPENWWPALPSVDCTVPRSYYLDQFKAIENNPLESTRFRTLLLNQWIGSPEQWLPSNLWAGCASRQPESRLYGKEAIIGIDYARRFDLTCYTVVIEDEGLYWLLPRFFIPRKCAQDKQERDNVPYLRWAQDMRNNIYFTEGDVVDPGFLRQRIKADAQLFRIKEIRFDPYGLEETRQLLEQEGYLLTEVRQTVPTMSPAFSKLQTLIQEGKCRHPDNPVANWCIDNCRPKVDKHDRLMLEKASDIQRVDFVDSTAIALTYWLDDKNKIPAPPPGQTWAAIW